MPDFACRRADQCSQREALRDEVTGDHLGFVGAQLSSVDGLCGVCEDQVKNALLHLPGDVAELSALVGKPLSQALTERVSSNGPGPTLPLREHLFALSELIDHETSSWAASLAHEIDLEWSTLSAHRSRIGHRVKLACGILRTWLPAFLELGPTEHRARSLGVRRTDGHDEEVATRYGDDYFITRDGLQGAIVLLDLHEKAWRVAQRHTSAVHVAFPCRRCGHKALYRELGKGDAQCRHCFHEVSEKHLDVLKTALANSRPAA
jgi:ribosomal protein S14